MEVDPNTTDPIAVELRNVVKRYGSVLAVNDINLQVRDGEFFSLLGPSGCGKTTTLRLIAGFESPTAGRVSIGGQVQGHLPPYQRPVNTVFQHYALFPHMTVYDNVAFGLEMQGAKRAEVRSQVEEILELVHLPGMQKRRPGQLSGGQQQRVALARALVNHPKVLLLDEPLGALDLKLRKAMQVELKSLQEKVGITFIYVTHDQEEALTMSDRIAVMNRGRILQIGSPLEIYEHPTNRFVADFIGETNFIPGTLKSIAPDVRLQLDGGVELPAGWAEEGLQPGGRALLSIRPEKIHLSREDPPSSPPDDRLLAHVAGEIVELVYMGTDTRYTVALSERAEMAVRLQNTHPDRDRFRMGERVTLSWERAFARVMKD